MASSAWPSVSTTTSANPECSARICQPPSSSPLTSRPSDIDTTRGLATAITAPLRITQDRGHPRRLASAQKAIALDAEPHALAHHVGHAHPGRLAEKDHGKTAPAAGVLDVAHLAVVGETGRRAFDGKIVAEDADRAAADLAETGHLAVGRRRGAHRRDVG